MTRDDGFGEFKIDIQMHFHFYLEKVFSLFISQNFVILSTGVYGFIQGAGGIPIDGIFFNLLGFLGQKIPKPHLNFPTIQKNLNPPPPLKKILYLSLTPNLSESIFFTLLKLHPFGILDARLI